MFCFLYKIKGFPLVGVWMGAIGSFIIVQSKKIRRWLSNDKKLRRKILIGQAIFIYISGSLVFLFLPAILFQYMEHWSFLDSFYCKFPHLICVFTANVYFHKRCLHYSDNNWFR